MLTITNSAADQIKESAKQSESEHMALRIAAKRNEDGSIEYGMGFDTQGEQDTRMDCNGVDVIVSDHSRPLVEGATLDYVELNPGDFKFIFANPNDPTHKPPQ